MASGWAWVVKMNWDADTQSKLVFEELMDLGKETGKAHKKEREKTIASWQGAKPAWKTFVRRIYPTAVKIVVMRIGDEFGKKKWLWLDEGTKVRYMGVNWPNWVSKTRVNWIGSKQGKGHTTGLGYPWPGIEARNWNIIINKKLNKRLGKSVITSIRKGLKRRRKGKSAGKRFIHG